MSQLPARKHEYDDSPNQPAVPKPSEEHDDQPERAGDRLMPPRHGRVGDMAAVELGHRQEVQHRHEHSDPSSKSGGMEQAVPGSAGHQANQLQRHHWGPRVYTR